MKFWATPPQQEQLPQQPQQQQQQQEQQQPPQQQQQYCESRRTIQERDDLREILETYCNSDKSNADIHLFSRNYLEHIANMTNNVV